MADRKVLGRAAKNAITAHIVDLTQVLSSTEAYLKNVILACEAKELITSTFKRTLTDEMTGRSAQDRARQLVSDVQNTVNFSPNCLDTFLSILVEEECTPATRAVADDIAAKYGHPLPLYHGGDTKGKTVPSASTATRGAERSVVPTVKTEEQETEENKQEYQKTEEQVGEQDIEADLFGRKKRRDNSPVYCYPMSAKPGRGLALIINNVKWNQDVDPDHKHDRRGSDEDAKRLKSTLEKLHYTVDLHHNLESHQMKRSLSELAQKTSKSHDSFICCILTHGDTNGVEGVDGIHVPVGELASLVNCKNCPNLFEKPKIFFVQSCRGSEIPEPVAIDNSRGAGDIVVMDGRKSLPCEADFFFSFSTCHDNIATRGIYEGSLYVKELCNVLSSYASSLSLYDLTMLVHREMTKKEFKVLVDGREYPFKQMPEVVSRLQGKVYFKD